MVVLFGYFDRHFLPDKSKTASIYKACIDARCSEWRWTVMAESGWKWQTDPTHDSSAQVNSSGAYCIIQLGHSVEKAIKFFNTFSFTKEVWMYC